MASSLSGCRQQRQAGRDLDQYHISIPDRSGRCDRRAVPELRRAAVRFGRQTCHQSGRGNFALNHEPASVRASSPEVSSATFSGLRPVRSRVSVVDDDRYTVFCQLHVELDTVGSGIQGEAKRGHCVLRRVGARTAMADDQRGVGHFFSSKKIVFDQPMGSVTGNS